MGWVTLVASLLTLVGVCWTVYRTDVRGARDLQEGRLRELRSKQQTAYLEFLISLEKYRHLVKWLEGVEAVKRANAAIPVSPPPFDFNQLRVELIAADAELGMYGSPAARQAAHVIREIAFHDDDPLSVEDSEKLYQ